MDLTGKNVLITGATGGIGGALALEFSQAGCALVLTGRDSEKLEQLQAELSDSGATTFAWQRQGATIFRNFQCRWTTSPWLQSTIRA